MARKLDRLSKFLGVPLEGGSLGALTPTALVTAAVQKAATTPTISVNPAGTAAPVHAATGAGGAALLRPPPGNTPLPGSAAPLTLTAGQAAFTQAMSSRAGATASTPTPSTTAAPRTLTLVGSTPQAGPNPNPSRGMFNANAPPPTDQTGGGNTTNTDQTGNSGAGGGSTTNTDDNTPDPGGDGGSALLPSGPDGYTTEAVPFPSAPGVLADLWATPVGKVAVVGVVAGLAWWLLGRERAGHSPMGWLEVDEPPRRRPRRRKGARSSHRGEEMDPRLAGVLLARPRPGAHALELGGTTRNCKRKGRRR